MEQIKPVKPSLEHREREDNRGVIVRELTPESEILWAKYLMDSQVAKRGIRRVNDKTDTTDAQGPSS